MQKDSDSFSNWRSFLWPIHKYELSSFLPMLILFFLISFNYHTLRITKDAMIITAPKSGAEVLPFLKLTVLPAAVIITLFFTHLSNWFSREKVFYVISSFFLAFFLLFLFVLYPHRDDLTLNTLADKLQMILPVGAKGLIALVRYWLYAVYYIFAEFWSTIMLSLLLWGFANDVITLDQSKRYYALFGIGINSSGIMAGFFCATLAEKMQKVSLTTHISSWNYTLSILVITIVINSILSMIIYRWLHVKKYSERRHSRVIFSENVDQKKQKMSLSKTLAYVFKSKYLIYLSCIVLAYNMVINFTEVVWKSQVDELFHDSNQFAAYMSSVTFYTGILATLGSYFVSGNVIRGLGWRSAALFTPIIALLTGIGFFYFLSIKEYFPSLAKTWTLSPLILTVFFGSLQNVLLRASKYTLFDGTKEMAFIPLSLESKLMGKSAIDGIGSRLGKSGSSFVLQILLFFFATPVACSGLIFSMIGLILPVWIFSIQKLGRQFKELSQKVSVKENLEKAV